MFNKDELVVMRENVEKLKTDCEVCGFYARDIEDLKSIYDEGACSECVLNFKHMTWNDWKKGIRPTREAARAKMNIFT